MDTKLEALTDNTLLHRLERNYDLFITTRFKEYKPIDKYYIWKRWLATI